MFKTAASTSSGFYFHLCEMVCFGGLEVSPRKGAEIFVYVGKRFCCAICMYAHCMCVYVLVDVECMCRCVCICMFIFVHVGVHLEYTCRCVCACIVLLAGHFHSTGQSHILIRASMVPYHSMLYLEELTISFLVTWLYFLCNSKSL